MSEADIAAGKFKELLVTLDAERVTSYFARPEQLAASVQEVRSADTVIYVNVRNSGSTPLYATLQEFGITPTMEVPIETTTRHDGPDYNGGSGKQLVFEAEGLGEKLQTPIEVIRERKRHKEHKVTEDGLDATLAVRDRIHQLTDTITAARPEYQQDLYSAAMEHLREFGAEHGLSEKPAVGTQVGGTGSIKVASGKQGKERG